MQSVLSVETMRRSDTFTIDHLVDSKTLMFRAGQAVFDHYRWKGRVAIVCGSGNNAGDGYVLALLLQKAGVMCRLFLVSEKFSADGRYYFEQCRGAGIAFEPFTGETEWTGWDIVVDCLLGTGFTGAVRGATAQVIERMNQSGRNGAAIVSVDINSGLNGDSGWGFPCVLSDLTVSIGYYQPGHWINRASAVMRRRINCDIGIAINGEAYRLVDSAEDAQAVLPSLMRAEEVSGPLLLLNPETLTAQYPDLADLLASDPAQAVYRAAQTRPVCLGLGESAAIASDGQTVWIIPGEILCLK